MSGWLSGGWEECWSKGWGAIFLFFSVWEIIHAVREQSDSLTAGLLAGALFASVPKVPRIAAWGYAEAPLWLMLTCGLACFLRWQRRENLKDLVLAGLFATAAAHTKNEGVLFMVLLGTRRRLRAAGVYWTVCIGGYLLWWYWSRLYYDLGSHATVGLHSELHIVQRALARIPPASEAIFNMWKDVRQWNIVGIGIALTLLTALVRFKENTRLYLFLPIGLLCGYLIIILFHPAEIYWQIGTAWNRLTVQALPLFLLLLVPMCWRLCLDIQQKRNPQRI